MSTADNSYFLNTIAQNLSNTSSMIVSTSSTSSTSSGSSANPLSTSTSSLGQSASCASYQQSHPLYSSGSTSVSQMDELVKEYLLYRGFISAFRAFDHDLKLDRDRSFRPDKITDQLLYHIHAFDLTGFLDYWSYLDQKHFSKLSTKLTNSSSGGAASGSITRRYELNLMRYYLVNAVRAGRPEKALEFLENYMVKTHGQPEWKDWFGLPFIRNPDEHPFFSVYFSQAWIDALIVSLKNFLNIVFQSLPFPRLLNYDEGQFWSKQEKVSIVLKLFFNQKSMKSRV